MLFDIIYSNMIKLFASDIDGTLTDGSMYYFENGNEGKRFCTYDSAGFQLLQNVGIICGLITSENMQLNQRRSDKMKLDFCLQGVQNKLNAVKYLCNKYDISLSEVAYIGDDVNDYEVLSQVGLAVCPFNAVNKIKSIPNIVQLKSVGGSGCIREFAEVICNLQFPDTL